ncbi:PTS sugar transporter subunit IIA [Lactobacillus sp. LL6]|uniref:PTS sugar transporter subunit IIA n=1 Tax=Lactobacillus sp. LL6 TaxID=2596827 RepID=UPI0011866C6D|nr:PTS sugar transporter subunit IIA [Lactobacillus sp. LL6]TSO25692.1 PTS sugar transporter subunit IIA [Lactobacillus sp. LL6]
MKINKELFSEDVLLFHQDVRNKDELFATLNGHLQKNNVVNDGFLKAIKKREENFPTGLNLESGVGVAIPHTDPEYVNKDQIGFISLNKPIEFKQMGSDTEKVQVKMVFILCLKEAHKQLDMLQNLMTIFGNSQMVKNLYECKSKDKFLNLIS